MLHVVISGLMSMSAWAQIESANRDGCSANKSTDVVSINIAFSYSNNRVLDLHQGPTIDNRFYRGMAAGLAPKTKIASLDDSTVGTGSKEAFLARLKSSIGSAKVVNLNYAGHGLKMPNGEFGLVLPNLDAKTVEECLKRTDPNQRGIELVHVPSLATASTKPEPASPPAAPATKPQSGDDAVAGCADIQKSIVTAADLRSVLGDRKVFGIIDACHAGSFDLGKNSSMLLSSQSNESASNGDTNGGAFTAAVKKKLANVCGGDADGDQQISYHELTAAMNDRTIGTTRVASRGLGRIEPEFQTYKQHPILNGRGWTDCFIPTSVEAKPCERSFKDGEALETAGPTEAVDTNSNKSCLLRSGSRVHALEDKTAASGRMKVEVPQSQCGFTEGQVPIAHLRGIATERARENVAPPPSNSAQ